MGGINSMYCGSSLLDHALDIMWFTMKLVVVWCTMRFNYIYRCLYPTQFINGYLYDIDTPFHKQQNKGVTFTLTTQHSDDWWWFIMDGWQWTNILIMPWMVWDIDILWATNLYIVWCWYSSQFIHVYMGDIAISWHTQPRKGVISILTTQSSKDGMDGSWQISI